MDPAQESGCEVHCGAAANGGRLSRRQEARKALGIAVREEGSLL
jgi:hypothetical protein